MTLFDIKKRFVLIDVKKAIIAPAFAPEINVEIFAHFKKTNDKKTA